MTILTRIPWSEITLILGAIISIRSLLKPLVFLIKEKNRKSRAQTKIIETIPAALDRISQEIEVIQLSNSEQNERIEELTERVDTIQTNLLEMERQGIVREVNSTFNLYLNRIHDIPDDILEDTLSSCEIYIEHGYNHNTRKKCEILQEEYDRRLREKSGR